MIRLEKIIYPVFFLFLLLSFLIWFSRPSHAENCIASIYSTRDTHSSWARTASGIKFSDRALTAAHKTKPLRSFVTVTHGNKSVRVQITDRGPYVKGRCIDLTIAASKAIGCGDLCRVSVN